MNSFAHRVKIIIHANYSGDHKFKCYFLPDGVKEQERLNMYVWICLYMKAYYKSDKTSNMYWKNGEVTSLSATYTKNNS